MARLRKRVNPATQAFWAELERAPMLAPGAIRALALGHVTVSCSDVEADAVMRWARDRPSWSDREPGISVEPA